MTRCNDTGHERVIFDRIYLVFVSRKAEFPLFVNLHNVQITMISENPGLLIISVAFCSICSSVSLASLKRLYHENFYFVFCWLGMYIEWSESKKLFLEV